MYYSNGIYVFFLCHVYVLPVMMLSRKKKDFMELKESII